MTAMRWVLALSVVWSLVLVAPGGAALGQAERSPGPTPLNPGVRELVAELPGAAAPSHRRGPTAADNMRLLANSPTGAVNSDLAFWGDKAFAGNYAGFRILDISDPANPRLLSDFACFGPQNDVSVWDRDGDGGADLLFTSVDRTLTGPECGAQATAHDDPDGWEGIRIFDVSNPENPQFVTGVYQDCGSHTHTLVPDPDGTRVVLYNSSYPLRPGPTCGPDRGPAAGRDPLHGVIQVIEVPLDDPAKAREIAEAPISYPGDPDNAFDPAEHGLDGFNPLRACHDIAVFLPDNLVAGACAEQAQLWRINPDTLVPDTRNPLWVFDNPTDTDGPGRGDTAADFWHSATFTWDGAIVNFSDESFGDGCPPLTEVTDPQTDQTRTSDTGRTYFLTASGGQLLSQFMIPRSEPAAYCSTHQGNTVATTGRNLLVQAWYMGGVDIVDFTNPRRPREVAFFDAGPFGPAGSDAWSHYWYEQTPQPGRTFVTYAQDGVHAPPTGRGFEVFAVDVAAGRRTGLDHLNPQTQEKRVR